MHQFFGLLGIAAILVVAFLLSSDKRAIRPRVVIASFALQALIWLPLMALACLAMLPYAKGATLGVCWANGLVRQEPAS